MKGGGYSWEPSEHPSFFPGRQATVHAGGQQARAPRCAALARAPPPPLTKHARPRSLRPLPPSLNNPLSTPSPPGQVGVFGVVHPEVLAAFDVPNPVSALVLNLEPFCFDQRGRSLLERADAGCS